MMMPVNKAKTPIFHFSFQSICHYLRYFIVAIVVLALDLTTKNWIIANVAENTYYYPPAIPIIPNVLYIVHVHNEGAVWGLFNGFSIVLGLFAIVTLLLIYIFRHTIALKQILVQYAFGLLTGGLIGNLIDRLHYQHVVDFILVKIGSYDWPAFNIADMGICVGVGIYMVYSIIDSIKICKQ